MTTPRDRALKLVADHGLANLRCERSTLEAYIEAEIAHVIMAEREACAKFAEELIDHGIASPTEVATALRNGSNPYSPCRP